MPQGIIAASDMRFVEAQARRLRHGWRASPVAPDTYEGLREDVREHAGRITVWDGGSERTVYGDPEVNHAFRAWHDATHLRHRWDFTLAGERNVATNQRMVAFADGRTRLAQVLFADVYGQALYYARHSAFPEDQIAFVAAYLADRDTALGKVF